MFIAYEYQEILKASDAERGQFLERDLWIGYPKAQEILERLEELCAHLKMQRMPNALIIGPSNNGKSMIKRKFCRNHEKSYEPGTYLGEQFKSLAAVEVISIQMPIYPSITRFIRALGDEIGKDFSLATRKAQEATICPALKKSGVKMIIIDEMHNILSGTNRQQVEFLNMIRYLGNELGIPIVCLGTKDAYLALRSDPQLENRFEPLILPVWEEGEAFCKLLKSFTQILPLKDVSYLHDPEMASWILRKSEGIIGEVSKIIKMAAKEAIVQKVEAITLKVLKSIGYQSPSERRGAFEKILS
jgi:Cdc6-like AAA superfamily ATPase